MECRSCRFRLGHFSADSGVSGFLGLFFFRAINISYPFLPFLLKCTFLLHSATPSSVCKLLLIVRTETHTSGVNVQPQAPIRELQFLSSSHFLSPCLQIPPETNHLSCAHAVFKQELKLTTSCRTALVRETFPNRGRRSSKLP